MLFNIDCTWNISIFLLRWINANIWIFVIAVVLPDWNVLTGLAYTMTEFG